MACRVGYKLAMKATYFLRYTDVSQDKVLNNGYEKIPAAPDFSDRLGRYYGLHDHPAAAAVLFGKTGRYTGGRRVAGHYVCGLPVGRRTGPRADLRSGRAQAAAAGQPGRHVDRLLDPG